MFLPWRLCERERAIIDEPYGKGGYFITIFFEWNLLRNTSFQK